LRSELKVAPVAVHVFDGELDAPVLPVPAPQPTTSNVAPVVFIAAPVELDETKEMTDE
jgi:hypothetical protein